MTTNDPFANWKAVDKLDMMKFVLELPEQFARSFNMCKDQNLPQEFLDPQYIVATGMGGSGIPGDFIKLIIQDESQVFFGVNKDYELPGYINDRTLVFAVSYSGTTEETINAFLVALKKGAKVFGITSGDRLLKLLKENNIPSYIAPKGNTTRGSFGYLLGAMLGVLCNLKIIPNKAKEVANALKMLRELAAQYHPESPITANEAKSIALRLYNKRPLVYSTERFSAAALRWKHQLNENPKSQAYLEVLPDVSHNQLAAMKRDKENVIAILLRSPLEKKEISRRFNAVKQVLTDNSIEILECWGQGDSVLEQLLSLSYLGDFVSLYLAYLYKVDPTPTESMSELKAQLGLTDLNPDKIQGANNNNG